MEAIMDDQPQHRPPPVFPQPLLPQPPLITAPELYYNFTLDEYQRRLDEINNDATFLSKIHQAAQDLKTKGYCVIEGVVETALCDYAHHIFWRRLERASQDRLQEPHSRADLAQFKKTTDWLVNSHGILEDAAFAHFDFAHAIRTHPRVATFFAQLYGASTGLIMAPDRINYQLPNEWLPHATFDEDWRADPDAIQKRKEASWLHVDQSFNKEGLHCVQGLVVMTDADQPGDASLEVVARSHTLHGTMRQALNLASDPNQADWYKFSEEDKAFLEQRGFFNDFTVVRARKGALIAWDSRAAHQGGRIRAHHVHLPRPNPTPRFVVYVCMQPAWQPLTRAQIKKKETIYSTFRSTSHWPLRSKMFGKPRTYGRELPEFNFERFLVHALLEEDYDGSGRWRNVFPTLGEFAGLTQHRSLQFPLPILGEPLLDFHPSSGMCPPSPMDVDREDCENAPDPSVSRGGNNQSPPRQGKRSHRTMQKEKKKEEEVEKKGKDEEKERATKRRRNNSWTSGINRFSFSNSPSLSSSSSEIVLKTREGTIFDSTTPAPSEDEEAMQVDNRSGKH